MSSILLHKLIRLLIESGIHHSPVVGVGVLQEARQQVGPLHLEQGRHPPLLTDHLATGCTTMQGLPGLAPPDPFGTVDTMPSFSSPRWPASSRGRAWPFQLMCIFVYRAYPHSLCQQLPLGGPVRPPFALASSSERSRNREVLADLLIRHPSHHDISTWISSPIHPSNKSSCGQQREGGGARPSYAEILPRFAFQEGSHLIVAFRSSLTREWFIQP